MARRVLGIAAGAVVAALGAVILGEYPFTGVAILGGGALFGLIVAQAVMGIGGSGGAGPSVAAALLAAAGLTWAAWISSGHELSRLPGEGWVAVALGGAVAAAAGLGVGARRRSTVEPRAQ